MSEGATPFSGIDAIIERMKQFPQEFFETGSERGRWAFIYKEYFRDSMTEIEKGRIHEQLKVVRRMEFDALVLKELFKEEKKEKRSESITDSLVYKAQGRYIP